MRGDLVRRGRAGEMGNREREREENGWGWTTRAREVGRRAPQPGRRDVCLDLERLRDL